MNNNYLDIESSVLYRCNQKYYDKVLGDFGIGYSQFVFLTTIFENEGILMNELAMNGSYDKGTVTKSIAKLVESEYVRIVDSKRDKRSKELYTTQKANAIMPKLYAIRQEWLNYLSGDVSEEELNTCNEIMNKVLNKARKYSNTDLPIDSIKFYKFDKLNMNVYKGKASAALYVGACNFRCLNCNRKDLVFLSPDQKAISASEVLGYLYDHKKFLDAVVVSGGEPLLNDNLADFLKSIKNMNLLVKLETNGSNFERLKEIIDKELVDYVSMSIKNTPKLYPSTIGSVTYDLTSIENSINYLKENKCEYEFVLSLSKQANSKTDYEELGKLVEGAEKLLLKNCTDNTNCINDNLVPLSDNEFEKARVILSEHVKNIEVIK